jgi:hypothetical protein
MKFSKEQIEDTIINGNIIDTKTKQEIIISEYEKSQKNIQPIWLGEGWYKGSPNSFNYFADGFDAGMNYAKGTK